jgi:hypothetical protein
MSTETELLARLGRDHAELVAGFTVARLPARVVRRTRRRASRKTIALLASAIAGMLATVIATCALVEHATGDALPTIWTNVIALAVALGTLTVFVLLFARDSE